MKQKSRPSSSLFSLQNISFFLIFRLISAGLNLIWDCDESMNYWEPSHYLLFGKGYQTWEYSPAYALRSYFYLLVNIFPVKFLLQFVISNKVLLFYLIRAGLALASSYSEVTFVRGIAHRFGDSVANLTAIVLCFSAGMFVASTGYLPSTFSMYLLMLAYGAFMQEKVFLTIISAIACVFVGWPFVGVLLIPVAISLLVTYSFPRLVKCIIAAVFVVLGPMVAVDFYYFRKVILAPVNILIYNVFEAKRTGGSTLYGTEPWDYYLKNGLLNFNIVFIFCIASVSLFLFWPCIRSLWPQPRPAFLSWLIPISPVYLWLAFMSAQPHKEERFLFVVYPFICLAGSVAIMFILSLLCRLLNCDCPTRRFKKMLLVVFILFSLSRIVSLQTNYRAPLTIAHHLHTHFDEYLPINPEEDINVCLGKEWYRFYTNFFIPTKGAAYQFIQSNFTGILPKPYSEETKTYGIPTTMNDLNRQEMDRYIPVERCHYLIDLDFFDQTEPHYVEDTETWVVEMSAPFLEAKTSPIFPRSFYIPFFSVTKNHFNQYFLLRNKNLLLPKVT